MHNCAASRKEFLKLAKEILLENERCKNITVFGQAGPGCKITIFKEKDFKPELAPTNATIEHVEKNDEKIVIMSYLI